MDVPWIVRRSVSLIVKKEKDCIFIIYYDDYICIAMFVCSFIDYNDHKDHPFVLIRFVVCLIYECVLNK